MIIEPGRTICFTEGIYDYYGIHGIYPVLKPFDLSEEIKQGFPCPYDVALDKHKVAAQEVVEYLLKKGLIGDDTSIMVGFGESKFLEILQQCP